MRIILTDQDRVTVETYLRSYDKIQAVLKVRQATGMGLKEAMDFPGRVRARTYSTPPKRKHRHGHDIISDGDRAFP